MSDQQRLEGEPTMPNEPSGVPAMGGGQAPGTWAPGGSPAGPSGWVQPTQAPAPQGWTTPATAEAPRSSAPSVTLAGVILLLLGLLTLLIGLVVLLAGSVIHQLGPAFDQAGVGGIQDAVGSIVAVVGAVVAIFGALEVIAAIGVFGRRGWGRALGMVTAALGVIFWLVALLGALGARAMTDQAGGSLVVVLVFLVAYGFSLLALALGGHAFRRRNEPVPMPPDPRR